MVEWIHGDRARTMPNLLFIERTTGEMRKSFYDDELVRTADGGSILARRCRFVVRYGLSERPDPYPGVPERPEGFTARASRSPPGAWSTSTT